LASAILIKCLSNGTSKWTLNDGPLPENAISTSNLLYIPKVSPNDRGAYLCEGVDEAKLPFWAISEAFVLSEWH